MKIYVDCFVCSIETLFKMETTGYRAHLQTRFVYLYSDTWATRFQRFPFDQSGNKLRHLNRYRVLRTGSPFLRIRME